jgi:TP901 family phage tail tape measure protein
MISSLEVGAVFRITDMASGPLKEVAAQLKLIDDALNKVKGSLVELAETKFPGLARRIGTLTERMDALAGSAQKGADGVDRAFASIDTAASASISRVQALKAELASLNAPALGGGGGGVGRRWGGAARGHGGFGGASVPLSPAGTRYHIPGGPMTAVAAAAGFGVWEEMELRDSIYKMFRTSGQPMGPMESNQFYGSIRGAILSAYAETGLPLKDIEQGYLEGIRTLAPLPMADRLRTLDLLMPHATTEAMLKSGTTVPEAVTAMAGLAHMSGQYGPEQLGKLASTFAYLSTTTQESLPQITRAASYAIPILRTSGYDPEQLLYMITAMQRAGIVNTKSGTWLDRMFEMANPGTSVISNRSFHSHENALKELGLIDGSGKQTFLGADGRPDAFAFIRTLHERSAGLAVNERNRVFKQLFGQQGERAAAFFSDEINEQMLAKAMAGEKDFISGHKFWEDAGKNNPMTEARKALADFNKALIDLGQQILPPLTFVVNQLDAGLKDLTGAFAFLGGLAKQWPSISLGASVGGAPGVWDRVKGWFGGGAGNSGPHPRGNSGIGGFWSPSIMKHVTERLENEAGLSPMGAAGLVARWAAIEAPGGPTSVNPRSGASGINQALGDRLPPGYETWSLDKQLDYIIKNDLNAPAQRRAYEVLRNAKTASQAAAGASMYERAEGFNGVTDNYTGSTPVDSVYGVISARDPWHQPDHPRSINLTSNLHIDGRKVATSTQKAIVDANTQVRGPSNYDGRSIPTPVDSGYQYNF